MPHPFFGTLGAQTTVQRWYARQYAQQQQRRSNAANRVHTRSLSGPSTHQQVGLYAGLVIEPEGSKWRDPDTGQILGGQGVPPPRFDGGPTSWRVDVLTANRGLQLPRVHDRIRRLPTRVPARHWRRCNNPHPDPAGAINPPAKEEAPLPINIQKLAICHGGDPAPCPEAISAAEPGTMVVNYRNEPIPASDPQSLYEQTGPG